MLYQRSSVVYSRRCACAPISRLADAQAADWAVLKARCAVRSTKRLQSIRWTVPT